MIKKLSLIFLAFLSLSVNAQESTASPYSFYGIGSLKFKGTAENMSMGGLSVYTDSIHLNLRNPAAHTGNNLTNQRFNNESRPVRFAVGGTFTSVNLKTTDASDDASVTTFDYLALNVPMGKFGFTFGLMPYTSVGYRLESLQGDLLDNRYRGEGGVNKVFAGIGYQLSKDLSIGVDVSYNFGNITNSSVKFVYNDEEELLNYQSRETNRSDLSGVNYNFGLSYKSMISEKLQLFSSLTFAPESDITSTNNRVFETIVINAETGQEFPVNEILAELGALNKTDLKLPSRTSVGLGIGQKFKWFLGAEYTTLKTGNFSNPIFDLENAEFEDSSSFAIGGFYIPNYLSFNKYFSRVVYRAGARYENSGLKINGESINEFGISFGVGLPTGNLFSNTNIGIEVGKRGTTSQNLVQENFVNFQISLSLNDRWFQKRKYF